MQYQAQMSAALGTALDRGNPFSWIKDEPFCGNRRTDVQVGVYIRHNQGSFQRYEMPRILAKQ